MSSESPQVMPSAGKDTGSFTSSIGKRDKMETSISSGNLSIPMKDYYTIFFHAYLCCTIFY